jgi:hypothetical protein
LPRGTAARVRAETDCCKIAPVESLPTAHSTPGPERKGEHASAGKRQGFGTPHSQWGWRSDSLMAREKMTPASWIAQPCNPRERAVPIRSRMAHMGKPWRRRAIKEKRQSKPRELVTRSQTQRPHVDLVASYDAGGPAGTAGVSARVISPSARKQTANCKAFWGHR